MITFSDTPQGTPEWLAERAGLVTASNASLLAGKGKTRETYLDQLAAERRYGPGAMEPSFSNSWMTRGNELEPEARDYFALMNDVDVAEVGLATNTEYPGAGASLDGLINNNIGLEIKCPKASTLQRYHRTGEVPSNYMAQIEFQMLICDLQLVHFLAYHPAMDAFHVVVRRDQPAIDKMAAALQRANLTIEEYMNVRPTV